ncbi:MAG: hypothetical protein AVDCRST_MAG33-3029 [uncultured Thermomicrobiales bacterium]|uniref:Uncharacterized protein n=1 Tax=uncultured Thermomicrobiales bacterium TaxID=1645740 RepID=A0A6J4VFG3_9BACT|nr:MAG: hypothetical protein AVDCRST_MAG33-3029 [uncultured Thermomicrobiales bacterium]
MIEAAAGSAGAMRSDGTLRPITELVVVVSCILGAGRLDRYSLMVAKALL